MNLSDQTLLRNEANDKDRNLVDTDSRQLPAGSKTAAVPLWINPNPARSTPISSYLEIPFRHKKLIIATILVSLLAGWMAIALWPRSYYSEAKLIVRVGRESVSLDPTATTSATLMLQKTQEEEIISALEVLNSRQVAEEVVEALTPAAILAGELPPSAEQVTASEETNASAADSIRAVIDPLKNSLMDGLLAVGIRDGYSDRERAVRKIQGSVGIYSPRKSTVMIITSVAKTPEMAQAIVKEMTDSFMGQHIKTSHTEGSYKFFETEAAKVEAELNELVAQRSKYMQENNIVSIDANRNLLQQRIAGLDRDLVVASGELEQAVSVVEDLKSKLDITEDEIVASKLVGTNPTWSGMRQKIHDLELLEQDWASRSKGNHPQLVKIREQLESSRTELAKTKSERVDENTTPNPLKMQLREALQQQTTRVAGLQSLMQQKEAQRDQLEQQINEMLDGERMLTETDRNISLLDGSLRMLREKLEEARVIEQLNTNEISNIHVFQPASLIERPVSPKKPVLAMGFLGLGMLTGLGLAFLREGASPLLRTRGDVENRLGLPVVSNIPKRRRFASPRLKDQRLQRQRCQQLIAEVLMTGKPSGRRGISLGIIGVDTGAGASTLAVDIAMASSVDYGMKTMLVDADTHQRSVSQTFGLNGSPGLVELVGGTASHDECVQRAKNAPIDLIASAADSCDESLTCGAMEIVQALNAYQHECDLMIVDLPSADQPDQAIAIAQHLDCIFIVVESDRTAAMSAERLVRHLSESDTRVVGAVLNKTQNYLPRLLRGFVPSQA